MSIPVRFTQKKSQELGLAFFLSALLSIQRSRVTYNMKWEDQPLSSIFVLSLDRSLETSIDSLAFSTGDKCESAVRSN
jgi:hypothetical protein